MRSIVVYVAVLCMLAAEVPVMAAALEASGLACKAPADATRLSCCKQKKTRSASRRSVVH